MMLLRLRWGMKRAYCCESGGGEGCGQEDDELGELHFAGRIWKIELIGIGCLNGWRLDCWRSMIGNEKGVLRQSGGVLYHGGPLIGGRYAAFLLLFLFPHLQSSSFFVCSALAG
jgi:hypothetical protein